MDFKGFNDWIEIFRGGLQIDSSGKAHDGDAIIEKALNNFSKDVHEPPLVVGHPESNSPAFGWVDSLKKTTKKGTTLLLARFRQVVPEFEAQAQKGLYKKRSASFYPDGTLRHVGFLGAAPPAVKGLVDLKFEENADIIFEFTDDNQTTKKEEESKMKFPEFIEAFKIWKQFQKDPGATLDLTPSGGEKSFTEADLENKTKEAVEVEREKLTAKFAENEIERLKKTAEENISTWHDSMVEKGQIIPSWTDLGLKEFCNSLEAISIVEFSEENKKTPLDWFKGFVEELPKFVNFNELATKDKDVKGGDSGAKLEKLIADKMKEEKSLNYTTAFSEVMKEHSALAAEYMAEFTQ